MTINQLADSNTLFDSTVQSVKSFYEELGQYAPPTKLDLLTQGVNFFLVTIDQLREYGDRVLAMRRDVSSWRVTVRSLASARKRIFERKVAQHLSTADFKKGLDAKERRSLTESQFAEDQDDAARWSELDDSLRDLYNDLGDRYKQLSDAKQDIRANLMALRLQLVLEKSGEELKHLLSVPGLSRLAQRVGKNEVPGSDDTVGPELPLVDPSELDELLK